MSPYIVHRTTWFHFNVLEYEVTWSTLLLESFSASREEQPVLSSNAFPSLRGFPVVSLGDSAQESSCWSKSSFPVAKHCLSLSVFLSLFVSLTHTDTHSFPLISCLPSLYTLWLSGYLYWNWLLIIDMVMEMIGQLFPNVKIRLRTMFNCWSICDPSFINFYYGFPCPLPHVVPVNAHYHLPLKSFILYKNQLKLFSHKEWH